MKHLFLSAIFSFVTFFTFAQNGYEIEVEIKDSNAKEIYLAYHLGSKQFLTDTAKIENGKFVFKGEEALEGGIYLVAVPPKNNYFELLIDENDQNFQVKTDTMNLSGNVEISGSANNEKFYGYIEFLGKQRIRASEIQQGMQNPDLEESEIEELEEELEELNRKVKKYQSDLVSENGGNAFVSKLIKANQEVEIPEPPVNEDGSIDSTFRYRYYKEHYFDNLTLSDGRFLRTPLLERRIDSYLKKMVSPLADSVIKETDYLLSLATDNKVYQYLLSKLLNDYAKSKIMGYDAIYVHLATNYYGKGKADWIDEEQLLKIVDNAKKLEPLLIGKKAPNLVLNTLAGKPANMYNLESKFTAVYFWDPDCGNCSKMSTALVDVYKDYKNKGFEIYGICNKTYEELEKCKEKETEKGLTWINTADPYGQGLAHSKYYIRANPTIYLLDENKVIRYKRIDAEQLRDILERELDGKK